MDRRQGGPLHVPRAEQGAGRHDGPDLYGAWYCSRSAVSAIAEAVQYLRGHVLTNEDFTRVGGLTKALVGLRIADGLPLIDLDDPSELVRLGRRPSQIATRRRAETQRLAATLFEEGAAGLLWWSTLDADWTNATLFHERALPHVSVVESPRPLSTAMPEVRQAAQHLGIEM